MLYKKDFKAIAAFLRDERVAPNSKDMDGMYKLGCNDTVDHLAMQFADYLSTTKPNFNRTKFLDACGVN